MIKAVQCPVFSAKTPDEFLVPDPLSHQLQRTMLIGITGPDLVDPCHSSTAKLSNHTPATNSHSDFHGLDKVLGGQRAILSTQ